MPDNNVHKNDVHTTDFDKVLRAEHKYIEERRKRVHITEEEKVEGLWGISFSNGGARASTLMLGVLRRLMSEDLFRRIDYMSAVGGSSFMAAAFASLLSGEKSTDKKGRFGTRPHNSPFLPGANEAGKGKGVTPEMQLAHFRKRIKDIPPHFWKHIGGGTKGLFGIAFSGAFYAFLVLLLILMGWMSLHHIYFYWISSYSGDLFQNFIINNKTTHISQWEGTGGAFSFVDGVIKMFVDVVMLSTSPRGLLVGAATAVFGALSSLGFFFMYLRPALKIERRRDVHIEVKVKQFYYFGFALTYFSLLIFGTVIHFYDNDIEYQLAFSVPVFLTAGIFFSGLIYGFATRIQYKGDDNRRALMSEISTAGFWMLLASVGFPLLLTTLLLTGGWLTFFISIVFFAIGTRLVFNRIPRLGQIKSLRWYGNLLPNFFIGFSVILIFASMGKLIFTLAQTGTGYNYFWFIAGCVIPALMLMAFAYFVRKNRDNLHSYFKNKKSEIYLNTDTLNNQHQARTDAEMMLKNIGRDNFYAPYLLLNAALNVHTSASPNTRRLRAIPFFFSKHYVGSEKTGYVKTENYHGGKTSLAEAMMTAAGNYHSGMGIHGFYAQAFLFTLFNLRLGSWMRNPWYYRYEKPEHSRGSNKFINFLREYLNRFSTRALHVNVSSGIHTGDHWGLTALLRRQCENIILCDFRSLDDLIPGELNIVDIRAIAAKNRAAIGDVEVEAFAPQPDKNGLCKSNVVSCRLTYENGKQGRLYYIKLAMSEALPDSILDYQATHPKFPFVFTSNLQESDLQFNSFVQLGESMAAQFVELQKHNEIDDMDAMLRDRIRQLEKQEELHNLDLKGLFKQEEILIKKLNTFRERYYVTSDIGEKFELEHEIEKIEDELQIVRDEIQEKQELSKQIE